MKTVRSLLLLFVAVAAAGGVRGQKLSKTDVTQWPSYMNNSDFSPLTQITPENVSRLTEAWTFHYGAGYLPSGSVSLDYRFEEQPLLVNGVMYFSTPSSPRDPRVKSTITALEPETGKVLWQY